MRRSTRLAALTLLALAVVRCAETPTSQTSTGRGLIGLSPSFTPAASRAFQDLAKFGLEVTNVHIRLTAPDRSVRDTVVNFPSTSDVLVIEMSVPLRSAGQTYVADLELRNAQDQVLFSGTQHVVASASSIPGMAQGAEVQINYTGPGHDTRAVSVSPSNPTLSGAGTVGVTATATDASGGAVSNLIVRWTTSDPSVATVTSTGDATATVASTGKRGTATISAMTPLGVTGATQVSVLPTAARIVVVSGGGQTGPAGTALPQPFVVEVQAADNLPVPGVPVTFRAVTATGSVSTASITSDGAGRASAGMTLGRTAGAYSYEATSGSFAPVSVTETASPALPASITVLSGDNQVAAVGGTLAQVLSVTVKDQFGAAVSGVAVQWAKASGGGSVGAPTSTTNAGGVATMTYTLGTATGTETIRASVSGVAAAVTFTTKATAGLPAKMIGFGGYQHAPAGAMLPAQLYVKVTDSYGNAVENEYVVWRVTGAGATMATFAPTVAQTDAGGLAFTTVTLGPIPGPLMVTAFVTGSSLDFPLVVDASASVPGQLSGYVYDAASNDSLAGVTVSVQQNGQTITTATTTSSGYYTTSQVPAGSYDIQFALQGYVATTIVAQPVNGTTTTQRVPLVPANPNPGNISGMVMDARTTLAITATATVTLRSGVNATTGTPIQTVQTNSGGHYLFTRVPAGTYTVFVQTSGYSDAWKTGISVGNATPLQDVFVSPVGAAVAPPSAIPLGAPGVSASRIPTTANLGDAAIIADEVRKHPKRASSTPR